MKKFFFLVMFSWLVNSPLAAANLETLLPAKIDVNDKSALQRGAKIYMNYCSGCHSLRYMRYNRMAQDLGLVTFDGEIDEVLLFNNLIFTHAKIQDPIEISLSLTDARQWFGTLPPDLSLITRKRSPDWIFTYLKSFYVDSTRPFGSNNLLIPGVAMPNVLAPLSGKIILRKNEEKTYPTLSQLIRVTNGEMTEQEFDNTLQDLVTFLSYVGDPNKNNRHTIGYFVLFSSVFFLL